MAKMTMGKTISKSFSKPAKVIEAKVEPKEVVIEKEVIKEVIVEKPVEVIKEVVKEVPVSIDGSNISIPDYSSEISQLSNEIKKLRSVDERMLNATNAALEEIEELALSSSADLQKRIHDLDMEIDLRIVSAINNINKLKKENIRLNKVLKIAGAIVSVLIITALII